jgi:hypothetical protein
MNRKMVVIAVGVLILGQLLFFNRLLSQKAETLRRETGRYETTARQLESEKQSYQTQLASLKKMAATIPPWLLQGFEDPEQGFMEFLDYLGAPDMRTAAATVSLGRRTFINSPVPAHAGSFVFNYSFRETAEAESFLHYLLSQERFPVQVTGFSASRKSRGVAGAELSLTLLLPPKLEGLEGLIRHDEDI